MNDKIIQIDRDKCVGCGLCISACHQGAIQLVDGKAMLVNENHCDGLGRCLPSCPVDALKLVDKEISSDANEGEKPATGSGSGCSGGGCSGGITGLTQSNFNVIREVSQTDKLSKLENSPAFNVVGEAQQSANQNAFPTGHKPPMDFGSAFWPIQLKLLNPKTSFLQGAELLIAADCSAFVHANFRELLADGKVPIIFCPKLDDNKYHQAKLLEIFENNNIRSVTVVKMLVPCCNGMSTAVKGAIMQSKKKIPYLEVTLGLDGTEL